MKGMARALVFAAAAIASAVAVWACSNGYTTPGDTFSSDAKAPADGSEQANGVGDAGTLDGALCNHAVPPPSPATFQGGAMSDFIVAVDDLDFGNGTISGAPPGYDLDVTCTCHPEGESCVSAHAHCDVFGDGRDNAVAGLADSAKLLVDIQGLALSSIKNGNKGLVLRVQGYNGTPDDSEITVSMYSCGGTVDGMGKPTPPKFDGTDRWLVDTNDLVADLDTYPAKVSQVGYVTGGVLVVALDTHLRVSDSIVLSLQGGTVTARITKESGGFHLRDAVAVGRWPVADAIGRLRTVTTGGTPICHTQEYGTLVSTVCNAADIAGTPEQDRKQTRPVRASQPAFASQQCRPRSAGA